MINQENVIVQSSSTQSKTALSDLPIATFCVLLGELVLSTSGDIMSTSGGIPLVHWGYNEYIGGYHDACGGSS